MKIYIKFVRRGGFITRDGFLIECTELSSKHFYLFADTQSELDYLLYDHLGIPVRLLSEDINRLLNGETIFIQDDQLVYGKED